MSRDKAPKDREMTWKTLSWSGMHSMPCQRPRQTSGMEAAQELPVALMMARTARCSVRSVNAPAGTDGCGELSKESSEVITVKSENEEERENVRVSAMKKMIAMARG